MEDRREQRVVVTYNIHVALIQECRRIAIRKGYTRISRITISDLLEYQERVAKNLEQDKKRPWYRLVRRLGFRNRHEQLSRVLDRAVELVEDQAKNRQDEDFHYMDFNVSKNNPCSFVCHSKYPDILFLPGLLHSRRVKVSLDAKWSQSCYRVRLFILFIYAYCIL